MALMTWLTVFPLITVLSTLLQQPLSSLPIVCRVMVITAIAVPTMTYLLMPQMTRLFAGWLYPSPSELPAEQPHATPLALEPSAALPLSVLPSMPVTADVSQPTMSPASSLTFVTLPMDSTTLDQNGLVLNE
jgi:hypothetical protein